MDGYLKGVLSNFVMPELSIVNLVTWLSAGAMIFGGVVPYIPQYREIKRSGNAEGFSTFVCLTLLIANLLRILFWFGKHFELPLLAQSVIMVFTMLAMVRLCVVTTSRSEIVPARQHTFTDSRPHLRHSDENLSQLRGPLIHRQFTDFDIQYFWKWTDFMSYVEFLMVFTLACAVLTYMLLNVSVYIETLGFLAVFFEAMLGVPQFYRNFQNKSTLGMSIKMVGFWTCGDIFKTVYFIVRHAPAQFWICGMLQVSIDIAILYQVFYYRRFPQHPPKTVL